jgi:hypothetical protein
MNPKTASDFLVASPKVFEGWSEEEEDRWERIGEASHKGWVWMTPAGAIPIQPMEGDEVLQFLEELTKSRPKEASNE